MTSVSPTETPPWTAAEASPNGRLIRASLYVGDLHPEATETDLIEAFGRVGPIASVRLCRDRTTLAHKSLCYGYVNFFSLSDASKALALLNHTELRGKPMRIMWCQRDPLSRKTGMGNLFVKNLDPSVSSVQLEKIFSKYGTILSCKVAEENGISKGFGFVQFDSEDSAMTALDALHGTLLEGKNLYVTKFIKKWEREGTCGEETFTNLYVNNLDDDLTEDLLKEKFSEHGKVRNAAIIKDREGKSRGFGFVQFHTHQEAKKAIEGLNGAQIGSKPLFVARAQKQAKREAILRHGHTFTSNGQDLNLYVKNLDMSIDDRKLREIFSPYGTVTSARVISDDKGVSKGFGFVSFTSAEDAKQALHSLNGTTVQGSSLFVALKQPREERSRELQNPHAECPPGLFYASNWDIFTPRYHTSYYNQILPHTPFTIPYLCSPQPLMHPGLGRHVTAVYPFGVENFWGNHSASVLLEKSEQETTKHFFFPRNPIKSDGKPYVSMRDHNSQPWKDHKAAGKWKIRNTHAASNESSRGSAPKKPLKATSSKGMRKKNTGKLFRPLVENIQPEHETKRIGTLLKMSKSNAQKLLNSPNSLGLQVERAVQILKAANS